MMIRIKRIIIAIARRIRKLYGKKYWIISQYRILSTKTLSSMGIGSTKSTNLFFRTIIILSMKMIVNPKKVSIIVYWRDIRMKLLDKKNNKNNRVVYYSDEDHWYLQRWWLEDCLTFIKKSCYKDYSRWETLTINFVIEKKLLKLIIK